MSREPAKVALSPSVVRRLPGPTLTLALAALILAVAVLSLTTGAAGLGLGDLRAALRDEGLSPRDQIVLFGFRLPRLALGMAVGASLAVSGVLLQGLFRKPLADPGIVGVSSGASTSARSRPSSLAVLFPRRIPRLSARR